MNDEFVVFKGGWFGHLMRTRVAGHLGLLIVESVEIIFVVFLQMAHT